MAVTTGDKVAVVTGDSAGVGRATVAEFVRQGSCRPWVLSRQPGSPWRRFAPKRLCAMRKCDSR